MAKYEKEFKRSVVHDYLAGGGGYKRLASKYGVDHGQIRHWVGSYRQNGDGGLTKKFSYYSAEFKLRVLKHMSRAELSFTQTIHLGGGGAAEINRCVKNRRCHLAVRSTCDRKQSKTSSNFSNRYH
jgi:transposase-like protein